MRRHRGRSVVEDTGCLANIPTTRWAVAANVMMPLNSPGPPPSRPAESAVSETCGLSGAS